jgi:hypothetical protein
MGIFSINMPMLYGEGKGAFLRLQEEIMKKSDDHSIFAWESLESSQRSARPSAGFLAQSPSAFASSSTIVRSRLKDTPPFTITNKGLHLQLPLKAVESPNKLMDQIYVAVLDCHHEQKSDELLGILVYKRPNGRYRRHHNLSFEGYNDVLTKVSGDLLPTINREERESLPKVSLYTEDEKNYPLVSGPFYDQLKIDKSGIGEKHAYLSDFYPQHLIQPDEKITRLWVFFGANVGILGFKCKDNSGHRFFVALQRRNETLAAYVDILHESEILKDPFAPWESNSPTSLFSLYISSEIPSTALRARSTGSVLDSEGMPIFGDRIKWQYPGKPWSLYVTIKRQLVSGRRVFVVYIETKENVPDF